MIISLACLYRRKCVHHKDCQDAIVLRNHIIKIVEQGNLGQDNHDLRKSLLTFVVVGGGFSAVETVG
jgi:NADH:ubiquinone reductase (H+-translocating)